MVRPRRCLRSTICHSPGHDRSHRCVGSRRSIGEYQSRARARSCPEDGTRQQGPARARLKPGGYALFVSCQGFRNVTTYFDVRDAKEGQTIPVLLQIASGGSVEVEPPRSRDDLELLMYPYTQRALLSAGELKSMPHIARTVHNFRTNRDEAYFGVRLSEILIKFGAPLGKELSVAS